MSATTHMLVHAEVEQSGGGGTQQRSLCQQAESSRGHVVFTDTPHTFWILTTDDLLCRNSMTALEFPCTVSCQQT